MLFNLGLVDPSCFVARFLPASRWLHVRPRPNDKNELEAVCMFLRICLELLAQQDVRDRFVAVQEDHLRRVAGSVQDPLQSLKHWRDTRAAANH